MSGAWRAVGPALGVAAVALAVLFAEEIGAAAHVWNTSTAYGHCWLVLPIAIWLLYERRGQAEAVASAPAWWAALLAVPLAVLWIGADVLGVMEGRQFALVGFVEVAALAALGPAQFRAVSAALLYLVFLVPFGAFLTTPLQDFTAGFVALGLDALGVPNRVTQFQIEIPEGNFYVAQACAGLRFLIASIAFGALYAVTMFRDPWRRVAFIAASCVVPVLANGVRALGIVMLGHFLGSAEAAATDHVLYGWIFFSIVIVALAMAGMPFRQDQVVFVGAKVAAPAGTGRRAMLAVLPVLAVAGFGPVFAVVLGAGERPGGEAVPVLLAGPACRMTGLSRAGAVVMQSFRCGDSMLAARTEFLPRGANPARVTRAGAAWAGSMVSGADTDTRVLAVGGAFPARWRLIVDEDAPHGAATLLVVDGTPAMGGVRDRVRLAREMLGGGGGAAPVAIGVAVTAGSADATEVLRLFREGQGDLLGRVRAAANRK
jgi:exosortase A